MQFFRLLRAEQRLFAVVFRLRRRDFALCRRKSFFGQRRFRRPKAVEIGFRRIDLRLYQTFYDRLHRFVCFISGVNRFDLFRHFGFFARLQTVYRRKRRFAQFHRRDEHCFVGNFRLPIGFDLFPRGRYGYLFVFPNVVVFDLHVYVVLPCVVVSETTDHDARVSVRIQRRRDRFFTQISNDVRVRFVFRIICIAFPNRLQRKRHCDCHFIRRIAFAFKREFIMRMRYVIHNHRFIQAERVLR